MKLEVFLWIMALISVVFAILSPKYRAHSLIVVGVLILTIVAIVVLANRRAPAPASVRTVAQPSIQQPKREDFEQFHIEHADKEDPDAKTRIGVAEVRFDQILPEFGSDPGTIRSVGARLHNDSTRYALTDYAYYLVVQDCVQAVCTTVYDQRGQASVLVPANQARDVVIAIRDGANRGVPTFRLRGTANIKLVATDTRAYQITSGN